MFQLDHVSLSLGKGSGYILEDISLSLSKGDRLGIVGPSGAGKTTLLRLFNRLNNPTQGILEFNHQPLEKIPIIQLRQQVVLVPQESKLLGMSAKETLLYPLKLQQLDPSEQQKRLETWTSKLHIPLEWLERHELELSVGQKQLIAIARALVMQPQILILDEPTSALDVGLADHLMNILIDLSEREQTTIIMVNHQLNLVRQLAQRVLYLQSGKILADKLALSIDWEELQENLKQFQRDRKLTEDFEEEDV